MHKKNITNALAGFSEFKPASSLLFNTTETVVQSTTISDNLWDSEYLKSLTIEDLTIEVCQGIWDESCKKYYGPSMFTGFQLIRHYEDYNLPPYKFSKTDHTKFINCLKTIRNLSYPGITIPIYLRFYPNYKSSNTFETSDRPSVTDFIYRIEKILDCYTTDLAWFSSQNNQDHYACIRQKVIPKYEALYGEISPVRDFAIDIGILEYKLDDLVTEFGLTIKAKLIPILTQVKKLHELIKESDKFDRSVFSLACDTLRCLTDLVAGIENETRKTLLHECPKKVLNQRVSKYYKGGINE
jgi:hypothetical protein